MITLMFLVSVLMIGALIVYFGNKKIAANLFEKTYRSFNASGKSLSPYKIKRKFNANTGSYYYIIHNCRTGQRIDNNYFWDIHKALTSLNELEKLENYKLTTIDIEG